MIFLHYLSRQSRNISVYNNNKMKPSMTKVYELKPMRERIIYFQEVIVHTAVVLTVITFELIIHYYFKCPCVSPRTVEENCGKPAKQCKYLKNSSFGWTYIFLPAMALLVVGVMWNPDVWKVFTGKCYRGRWRGWTGFTCMCFSVTTFTALIAPSAWIAVTFIEGDYYACAMSTLPYEFKTNGTKCEDTLPYSDEYSRAKSASKLIGWILVVMFSVSMVLVFSVMRCCFTKTYYRDRYDTMYRELEERKLEAAIRNKVDEETRGITDHFQNLEFNDETWLKIVEAKCLGKPLVDVIVQRSRYSNFGVLETSPSTNTLVEQLEDYSHTKAEEINGFKL